MLTTTVDYVPRGAKHCDVVWSSPRSSPGDAITNLINIAEEAGASQLIGVHVIPNVDVDSSDAGRTLYATSFVAMGTVVLQGD